MMRIDSPRVALTAALGALGALVMLSTTPTAFADPVPPLPDPSQPVPVQTLVGDIAPPVVDPATPPVPADAVQPLSGDPAAVPQAVPHLPSPDNLPPGTTEEPIAPSGRGMGYLRELWHAVQTQDVSGSDALLLLAQRPMDANATPPAGMRTGPQGPVVPAAPVAPDPALAPAPADPPPAVPTP